MRRDHLVDLEHVGEALAQVGDARLQIVAFAKEELMNSRLDLALKRLEEDQKHDRREDGVQVHRVEAADDHHEEVEDRRQGERERGRHEEPTGQLVNVGEARARHRLGQDEEKNDGERRANRRQMHPEVREKVGQREGRGGSADHHQKANAIAHGARSAALPPRRERDKRRGEEAEDVRVDGAQREGAIVVRRNGEDEDGNAEHRGEPGEPRPPCSRGSSGTTA